MAYVIISFLKHNAVFRFKKYCYLFYVTGITTSSLETTEKSESTARVEGSRKNVIGVTKKKNKTITYRSIIITHFLIIYKFKILKIGCAEIPKEMNYSKVHLTELSFSRKKQKKDTIDIWWLSDDGGIFMPKKTFLKIC